jgi:hypothetical protein
MGGAAPVWRRSLLQLGVSSEQVSIGSRPAAPAFPIYMVSITDQSLVISPVKSLVNHSSMIVLAEKA